MRLAPIWLPLVALFLALLVPGADLLGKGSKSRSPLMRPPGAVDDNAKGRIEVRSRRGRERLTIKAERLDRNLAVQVFIADSDGTLEQVASVTGRGAQVKVRWDTKRQSLPHDASDLSELAGRKVRLDGPGGPLLEGTIPSTSSGDDGGGRQRDRLGLENDDTSFAPRGTGKIDVDYRPSRGKSKLEVEVEHVPPGTTFQLFLVDPDDPGAGVQAVPGGTFTSNALGEARIEYETEDGDTLPFGETDVSRFFGLALEVHSGGVKRFSGTVPTP